MRRWPPGPNASPSGTGTSAPDAPPPPGLRLARGRAVRVALNQTLSDEAAALADGAEVAFFPPVTGG